MQIYVDDIIFGIPNVSLCENFANWMNGEFEMNFMEELTLFLGLQIKKTHKGDNNNRKSTSETCQILSDALISGHSKKLTLVVLSTTEAEYIAVGSCGLRHYIFWGNFLHKWLWPENFEVSFEKAKKVAFDPDINLSSFGPLSFCFKYRIMAYIIAAILIPQKGYLSNMTCRDKFQQTYDSKTFASIGYILLDNEWCKKDFVKSKLNLPKVTKSVSNPVLPMLKKLKEIKAIKKGLMLFLESTTRRLQLGKDTSTDVGKM
ncbi:hypothetical protein FXO38_23712 [Capsicum annuum]|nr:hypothetical protein FXO38_23712 [Capsicum annuum]